MKYQPQHLSLGMKPKSTKQPVKKVTNQIKNNAMQKKFKIIPPTMPNFVRFEQEPSLRQEGFKPQEGYDIKNFTKQEAIQFGELMKKEFIKHWEKRNLTHKTPINKI